MRGGCLESCKTGAEPLDERRGMRQSRGIMEIERVCVYCGSSSGDRPAYAGAARDVGRLLVSRGIDLIYGGGGVGLMGAVADSVLAGGGHVTGVIPTFLEAKELAHRGVSELHVVETMHERKLKMMELADAFIALPGGFGTLEELFEVLAWSQLQLHSKPVGLLNVSGFYDGLLGCVDHMVGEALLRGKDRGRLMHDDEPERLLEKMAVWRAPAEAKWEDPDFPLR